MRTVGERLRQAREARGLSGEALARRVGYKTQSGIANLENRATGHGGYKLAQIAQELNVSVAWLLKGPDTDDAASIPPFEASDVAQTPTAQESQPNYRAKPNDLRAEAHALIDALSDRGLLAVISTLRALCETHPAPQTNGSGLPAAAQKRAA